MLITSYELARLDEDLLIELGPDLLTLDEAQRIKNWRTQTASGVKRSPSRFCFVLTGTPLENRLDDLYSLMQVIDPHRLGPLRICQESRTIAASGVDLSEIPPGMLEKAPRGGATFGRPAQQPGLPKARPQAVDWLWKIGSKRSCHACGGTVAKGTPEPSFSLIDCYRTSGVTRLSTPALSGYHYLDSKQAGAEPVDLSEGVHLVLMSRSQ